MNHFRFWPKVSFAAVFLLCAGLPVKFASAQHSSINDAVGDGRPVTASDILSAMESDLIIANGEHLDYVWPVPEFGIAPENFSDQPDSALVIVYSAAANRSGQYLQDTVREYSRLSDQREFWSHRARFDEVSMTALAELSRELSVSDATSKTLLELHDLALSRQRTFEALAARYDLSLHSLEGAAEYALTSQRMFVALFRYHANIPPGAEAFDLADQIRDAIPTPAQQHFAVIKENAARSVRQMQQTVRALQEESAREASRLRPLQDLQQALQIASLVVQTYQILDDFGAIDAASGTRELDVGEHVDGNSSPSTTSESASSEPAPPTTTEGSTESQPASEVAEVLEAGPLRERTPIDRLQEIVGDLGGPPPDLTSMTDQERAAYFEKVTTGAELLRAMEPTYADLFEQNYKLESIDIASVGKNLDDGIFDGIAFFFTPQVLGDDSVFGRNARINYDQTLKPHLDMYMLWHQRQTVTDYVLTPSFPPIEIPKGPQIVAPR